MRDIDKKKYEVELMKVQAARADLELKKMERQEDILRIEENIEKQNERELELKVILEENK